MSEQLIGTHRGVVVDNEDPLKIGRLKIQVPAAYGNQPASLLPWAWPLYKQHGEFYIPRVGENVYVEFMATNGKPDPSYPIWTGVWKANGEAAGEVNGGSPMEAQYYRVEQTTSGHKTIYCDKPGKEYIKIQHKSGSYILFNEAGEIVINGKMIRLN